MDVFENWVYRYAISLWLLTGNIMMISIIPILVFGLAPYHRPDSVPTLNDGRVECGKPPSTIKPFAKIIRKSSKNVTYRKAT